MIPLLSKKTARESSNWIRATSKNADDANLSLGVECGEQLRLAGQGQQGSRGIATYDGAMFSNIEPGDGDMWDVTEANTYKTLTVTIRDDEGTRQYFKKCRCVYV